MLCRTLVLSTLFGLVLVPSGTPQQIQQSEAQQGAEQQRRAEAEQQREVNERLEQLRRAQTLADRQAQERAEQQKREQLREDKERLEQQRRAHALAERQREEEEREVLLRRRAEAERQQQILSQQEQQGPPTAQAPDFPPESVAPSILPPRPEIVQPPGSLSRLVAGCLFAGATLGLLGWMVRHRFTSR